MNIRQSMTIALAATLLAACEGRGGKGQDSDSDSLHIVAVDSIPAIREVSGRVTDATTMHVVELVTDQGDTLDIETGAQGVSGGARVGERLSVVYNMVDGQAVAQIAVNLDALCHLWSQSGTDGTRQSLELLASGHAVTYDMPHASYDRWAVRDGRLLLFGARQMAREGASADTFDILWLDTDTLVLAHGSAQTTLWREN